MASDEEIVGCVRAGDTDAFGELINRYEIKLKRYGARFLGRTDDIEDMVQDVFIKAYTNLQSFDTTSRFSPWIYRIAHNTFVNELRRQSRFRGFFVLDTESFFPTLVAPESSLDLVLEKESAALIEEKLSLLGSKDREIILLAYFEELSYEAMSDILHIPISAVGVRLHRAKTKLKRLLNVNEQHI
jgi:RNA polymerase sigma-70 factor (ECF subfamily)